MSNCIKLCINSEVYLAEILNGSVPDFAAHHISHLQHLKNQCSESKIIFFFQSQQREMCTHHLHHTLAWLNGIDFRHLLS